MAISIVITTYGEDHWWVRAQETAVPSALKQTADQVVSVHCDGLEIGPARNAVAATSKGDWLIFLDADDELEPGYVEHMRNAAQGKPKKTLFQPSVRYVRGGVLNRPVMLGPGDLRHDNYLVVGTMIHRDVFHAVGGFSDYPHGFEDYALWAKAWKAGAQVTQVPQAVYRAYVNPQSKHRQMWRRRAEQLYWHQRVQHDLFPKDFPFAPTPPGGGANG